MRKVMFNDKYHLTQAVLNGRKTMTRRIVPQCILDKVEEYRQEYYEATFEYISFEDAILNMVIGERMFWSYVFHVGEEVAVAQSYKKLIDQGYFRAENGLIPVELCEGDAYDNKMFVRADFMPHRIRITGIKLERLQDISDEDCMKEGIMRRVIRMEGIKDLVTVFGYRTVKGDNFNFSHPRGAFASLIDKVSGKGTWERNPWVLVYSFHRV